MKQEARQQAFSLVELIVVVSIIGILAALLFPALEKSLAAADQAKCVTIMRQLAASVLLATAERGEFPRSSHSAFAHGERGWSRVILSMMGEDPEMSNDKWAATQARLFRCPADKKRKTGQSYGLNVYFELDPSFDEYEGSPLQWRRPAAVPNSSQTILLAEVGGNSDHVMAHFWTPGVESGYDCAHDRHKGKSNYAFVDGHVELLRINGVFDPSRGVNRWNPSLAR